ncbi:MAG: MazG family protein [Actinobacteria bacterium]|nr:MazG family protein [Actinomycetota bacterium]
MALFVVALASDEEGLLTVAELDRLTACQRVLFEDPSHPLFGRLSAMGVATGPFDDEPDALRTGWALVASPSSARVLELARAGAEVSGGVARRLDSLTNASGAHNARAVATALTEAALVMSRLRSDDGCPWDREQTHESLQVHLLEEAHEVIEAIESGDTGAALEEELGDVLLQVLFHARLAEQDGRFDIEDVAGVLVAKLIRRHPHVFGDGAASTAGEVVTKWEQIKRHEKGDAAGERGPFAGLPSTLPALLTASKVQKRAAGVGFEVDEEEARRAVASSVAGPASPESLGRALFWIVALCRSAGIDPEGALRRELGRFRSSFDSSA